MKLRSKKYSAAGFGITEVLVALGLLSVISLGVGTVLKDMLSAQKTSKMKMDADNFNEELRAQLGSLNSCFNTLHNFALTPGAQYDVSAVKNSEPSPDAAANIYVPATNYGDGSFKINSMKFFYLADDPSDSTSGIGELAVSYVSSSQTAGGGTLKDRRIQIKTKKDAANKMLQCVSLAKMTDGIWRRSLTNIGDIFYNTGKVGIGTTAPDQALTVAGSVHTTSVGLVFPDGKVMSSAPPNCTVGQYLQWDGHSWLCGTPRTVIIVAQGGGSSGGDGSGHGGPGSTPNSYNFSTGNWGYTNSTGGWVTTGTGSDGGSSP